MSRVGGGGGVGGLGNSLKFNILSCSVNFFYVHLYKTSIYVGWNSSQNVIARGLK